MGGNGPGTSASGQYDDVTCPFCGILCDDLKISVSNGAAKVLSHGCAKAVAGFERILPAAEPMIRGERASLDAAVAEAAALIKSARLPVFSGLGTDVGGMRGVMELGEAAGGVIDHAMSESQHRNYRVLQRSGWVLSTLGEARNRADLFILLGSDVASYHPRFFERIVTNDTVMFGSDGKKRTVICIGENLDPSIAAAKGGHVGEVIHLPVKSERLGELLVALTALQKGVALGADSIAGLPRAKVDDLLARMKAADYGVMVWVPSCLAFPNADLTVQAASDLLKDINLTSRFAGLSLGGNEGSASAAAVCAWQSGFPLRVSYASGAPIYDADRFSTSALLANGECDLLVWLSSFTTELMPPASNVPTIVLATPGFKAARQPEVFIPVGTPGIDHDGAVVRCDSSISLPLKNLGRAHLPRAEDVLEKIRAAL